MSGLTAFLQTELLTLSSEARRKHPEIKEAAERLSAILRSFKERPGYSIANELSKSEDALRPFVLACETKQVKLVTIAIGCIQKLISFHAIPETSVRAILRTLTDISVHGVEIQLKILQTVLPLLTNYRNVHDDILAEALLICFRLQDSKIAVVNNTAAATLRQIVIFVFDKVGKEDMLNLKQEDATHEIQLSTEEKIKLHPCAKDAYYLFRDLCLLTSGDPPEYLRLGHLSKTFGLELVESVLANHYTLFKEHQEFSSLLRECVCPLIIKTFSEKHEFSQTMRLARVVDILIRQFNEILITECEIFLSMFVKILEPENPLWQRVLAMEIFRAVCSDPVLLCSIYRWYDCAQGPTVVFRDMITAFGRLATEKPQLIGATQGGRESIDYSTISTHHPHTHTNVYVPTMDINSGPGLNASSSSMRIQCIDQLDKADPPIIPETYIFYLALLCLNSIADGLAGFVLPMFSPGKSAGYSTKNISNAPHADSEAQFKEDLIDNPNNMLLVTDMANVAWPGLLAAMSFYISSNLDEELFQNTMRSYQNFTNVCGMLDLVVPRDAFLTNLCKNAIPPSSILSSGFLSGKLGSTSTTSLSSITNNTSLAVSYTDLSAQQQHVLANISLSNKNLYSLRVLLNIAMFLGGVLGSSWYLVLETLQQADLLLINRPTPKGASTISSTAPAAHTMRRTVPGTPTLSPTAGTPSPSGQSMNNHQMMDADHAAIIQTSLSRLFDNSKYLDNKAFVAFTTALCRLSAETSCVPFSSGEAMTNKSSRMKLFNKKSFAVDQLCYIAILNMNRLISSEEEAIAWDLLTSHLIATANFPLTPASIRTQCCEVIATIIITAMNHIIAEKKEGEDKAQLRLLAALSQCINYVPLNEDRAVFMDSDKATMAKVYVEVQKMGLETLNKLLETSGHSITCGWGLVFDMLRHITTNSPATHLDYIHDEESEEKIANEEARQERLSVDTTTSSLLTSANNSLSSHGKVSSGLIRVAFSSLQLICTDFLSLLSPDCLRQCIATLGSFGMQSEDLNISLTAVGLLWNLSDFIQTKRAEVTYKTHDEEIDKESMNIDLAIADEASPQIFSTLWMLLLLQLSHNCTDWRPEVRNGANQTLFRTIMMNGSILGPHLWNACVWKVLFPLLDAIKMSAIRATRMMQSSKSNTSSSMDRDSSGFMLHHSRDTADKQWDETKVLVLTGISTLFRDFLGKLYALNNFKQVWSLLLAHLEDSCLRSSQEVSLASIKSFTNIVTLLHGDTTDKTIVTLWENAWHSWKIIGSGMMAPKMRLKEEGEGEDGEEREEEETYRTALDSELLSLTLSLSSSSAAPISGDFTQDTLTAYVKMFTDLYKVIAPGFSLEDTGSLLGVLRNLLVYSTSPQYRPDIDTMSPLQEAVLEVIQVLDMSAPGVPPLVLMDLSDYMTLAFLSPEDTMQKSKGYIPPSQRKFSTVTYIALNKKCSLLAAEMFKTHHSNKTLYTEGVFERMIGAFGLPMKLKYDCPPSHKHGNDKTPLWKSATQGLLAILQQGLEQLDAFGDISTERFVGVWRVVVDIFEGSLLSPSTPPPSLPIEKLDADEQFDISVLEVIQNDIVVYMGQPRVPKEVIQKWVNVIRESSRLYYIDANDQRKNAKEKENNPENEQEEKKPLGDRSSDIMGTTGTIVPVMKESFAYAALKTLFSLCSTRKEDYPQVRKRIAQIAIPVLLERCETVLRNYMSDGPLLGRCPFPRVRKEEIVFLLQQSIHLKLQENIIMEQSGCNKEEKEEDRNECSEHNQHSNNSNNNNNKQSTIKHLVLSGPKAHLFYLYPSLCNMMTCSDAVVVGLTRECLQTAGTEMGLMS